MFPSLIISICLIRLIYTQEIDEIVECQPKNLTNYRYDQMNFKEQERLVSKFVYFFLLLSCFTKLIINESDSNEKKTRTMRLAIEILFE